MHVTKSGTVPRPEIDLTDFGRAEIVKIVHKTRERYRAPKMPVSPLVKVYLPTSISDVPCICGQRLWPCVSHRLLSTVCGMEVDLTIPGNLRPYLAVRRIVVRDSDARRIVRSGTFLISRRGDEHQEDAVASSLIYAGQGISCLVHAHGERTSVYKDAAVPSLISPFRATNIGICI